MHYYINIQRGTGYSDVYKKHRYGYNQNPRSYAV